MNAIPENQDQSVRGLLSQSWTEFCFFAGFNCCPWCIEENKELVSFFSPTSLDVSGLDTDVWPKHTSPKGMKEQFHFDGRNHFLHQGQGCVAS